MEFQIKESYGDGCYSWCYFKANGTETIDELKKLAVDTMREEYSKQIPSLYFSGQPPLPRPTIEVGEYAKCKLVKNGIRFKTKWR